MSASVILSCDKEWYGEKCRGATPVGPALNGAAARATAHRLFGWTSRVVDGRIVDVCEACQHRERTGRTPVPAPRPAAADCPAPQVCATHGSGATR